MEEELSFDMMLLSLKDMAMRKVVVNLWKQSDILCRFDQRFITPNFRKNTGVETMIADKISDLKCPESLKKEMRTLVSPIGIQIETWKNFHQCYLENQSWQQILEKYSIDSRVKLHVPILKKLYFTSLGMIDNKKTAQELILCNMFDAVKLYKLACLYCLADLIPLLWIKLPWEIKIKFYKEEGIFRIKNSFDLQFCWHHIYSGEIPELDTITSQLCGYSKSFHTHALEFTIHDGNIAAAKYFLGQLTPCERQFVLDFVQFNLVDAVDRYIFSRRAFTFGLFSPHNKAELLIYLISQMNREQQMKLFKENACTILSYFLEWPWHDLCLKLANHFRAFLFEKDYEYLLAQMHEFLTRSQYSYGILFQDFFPRSPVKFRKQFVCLELLSARFLSDIFNLEDSESAKVLFRNVSSAHRMIFVSSDHFFELIHHSILLNKLNMVKLCLQEARLSKKRREILKKAFVAFGAANRARIKLQEQVHSQFFMLLNQIYGENKRCLEGETMNNAKKLCSIK